MGGAECLKTALFNRFAHQARQIVIKIQIVQRCKPSGQRFARPEQMPEEFVRQARSDPRGVKGAVCDYIAGMTDNYAVHTFTRLFIPKNESL